MAAHGEIVPMPDCAIFADTQWERAALYEYLAWLSSPNVLPFPVHRVTRGNLRQSILDRRNTSGGRFAAIPWFIRNEDGSEGMGRRQCTSEFKLTPVMWKLRELLGKGRRERIAAGAAEVWIGISTDEADRMKPARAQWQTTRYPLIELGMSRRDCVSWLRRHDYPVPQKSACIGCPFHGNAYWRDLRDNHPVEWTDAVDADLALRTGPNGRMNGAEFMHRDRIPLAQVDLGHDQAELFSNECEGQCGL